jgi:membrane fusion protein, multidrug efflux system
MSEIETPPRTRELHISAEPALSQKDSLSNEKPKTVPKGLNPASKKFLLMGTGTLAILLLSYVVYGSYMYVSTDNAMVQAHATLLSSQVRGVIVHADVEENQKVKAGQLLIEIKQDDFENALKQREADSASLAAQLKGARLTYQRTLALLNKGASTQERLDSAEAVYKSLENKLKSVQSEADEAKLNLGYTQIMAPVDGKVGRRSFEVGMLATPGQPLLGFVSNDERWVTANLKETDMADVVEGKKAYVTVDAIPGREFEGVVASISPATGASFTLLPPDNATGNFTKVVQRVPVRIKLLNLTEHDMDRLQNGLSADVKIRVH